MQFVDLFSIPEFFQKGSLFQELSGTGSEDVNQVVENTTLSFPIQYCHFDTANLLVVDDVCSLLSTLRFWGVN
jgi:hypothetical protein